LSSGVNIRWDPSSLTVEWPDGRSARFPAVWLCDQRADHRDPHTGQRLVDIADLPERPEIQSLSHSKDVVTISWADESAISVLAIDWLRSLLDPQQRDAVVWTSREVNRFDWTSYTAVRREDRSRLDWLTALMRNGIAFLTDVPAIDGEVANAAHLLGYITETNYGRIFDVRATAAPNNLAYTPLGLGVHTDNPYRDPVPGYQLLHCITSAAQGGESIFVDGFAVASTLRDEDPAAFAILVRTPVDFAFRDSAADLAARRTLIQVDRFGAVEAIHYNNRSISTARIPPGEAEGFYRAYRKFAQRLRAPEFEYRVTLKPGDLVAFDNSRVLHGRTPFTGSRLLQGCYVARDGVASNLAVLRRKITS
jgi:gamma-butyrobetaine dioxygenase